MALDMAFQRTDFKVRIDVNSEWIGYVKHGLQIGREFGVVSLRMLD
jgi:hypothetical protein